MGVDTKFWDVTYDSLPDKSISRAAQPQISGLGRYGHTLSLQYLASQGVVILGRALDVESGTLVLGDDAAAHVHFADEFSQRLKNDIDVYLERMGITPPPLEEDLADRPDVEAKCVSPLRALNLREANVSTVIWATGFTGDFSWIHLPVFTIEKPIPKRGISPSTALYFVVFPCSTAAIGSHLWDRGDAAIYCDASRNKWHLATLSFPVGDLRQILPFNL